MQSTINVIEYSVLLPTGFESKNIIIVNSEVGYFNSF